MDPNIRKQKSHTHFQNVIYASHKLLMNLKHIQNIMAELMPILIIGKANFSINSKYKYHFATQHMILQAIE